MDPPSKILSTLTLEDPRVGGIDQKFSQIHPGVPSWYGVEEKTPKKGFIVPKSAPANPRSRALHHVIVFTPVICHFVGAHGGTKTSKGRDRKIMFLWWAGLPKVGKWPFLGFHKLKNRHFDPYFGNFMTKKWGKMFIFMFKTTQEFRWGVYRLYL